MKMDKKIFGMIHLLPTMGFKGYPGMDKILARAIEDLNVLQEGGVDGIIIENNYDLPHNIKVGPETTASIGYVLYELKKLSKIPIGLSVLWNDYKASLALAKAYDCDFVRVPVFVDHVKTSFGEIQGDAEEVIDYRKKIDAENVKLYVDIQVKHAKLLNKRPISKAAKEAIEKGADGLIVTGKWTGDAPILDELKEVKQVAGDIPVIVGSGADKDNLHELFEYSDIIIIGTYLKEGESKSSEEERNIKPYDAKIELSKVKELMASRNAD